MYRATATTVAAYRSPGSCRVWDSRQAEHRPVCAAGWRLGESAARVLPPATTLAGNARIEIVGNVCKSQSCMVMQAAAMADHPWRDYCQAVHVLLHNERENRNEEGLQFLVSYGFLGGPQGNSRADASPPPARQPAVRVRFHIIRNARIDNVGKSQSCMVSKLRIIWKQTVPPPLPGGP